jgi:hypothetical protein
MTTSSFVDYMPKSERTTGLVKATVKINENHELGMIPVDPEQGAKRDRPGAIRRPVHEPPASGRHA